MTGQKKGMKPWLKKLLITGLILLIAGAVAIWYIFTEKFADTSDRKAAYTVSAMDLLKEFQQNDTLANKKYADQIVTVSGRVTEIEAAAADTTMNIRMTDTTTQSYVIFAFQQQHLNEAKQLKVGDSVSIKGSCSGGIYSDILETIHVDFKRSAVDKVNK
ncbi:OB-fold protein [Ferruginibacter sp.]